VGILLELYVGKGCKWILRKELSPVDVRRGKSFRMGAGAEHMGGTECLGIDENLNSQEH
jgi:hypothetical protein